LKSASNKKKRVKTRSADRLQPVLTRKSSTSGRYEEGQLVPDKLADEALAEIRAGNAKSNGNWPFNKPLLRE